MSDLEEFLRPSEFGDCILTTLSDRRVHVDQADPRVRLSTRIIHDLRAGQVVHGSPYITLDDDLLRIDGVNRLVIYRLAGMTRDRSGYIAEWPD